MPTLKPFTKAQIKHFCDQSNPDWFPDVNTRLPKVQKDYDTHLEDLKLQGVKPETHIIKTELTIHGIEFNYRLGLNNYPYNVEKGCSHLLCWFKKDYQDIAEAHLTNALRSLDFVYSQAPKARRSIPGLGHFHIFTFDN